MSSIKEQCEDIYTTSFNKELENRKEEGYLVQEIKDNTIKTYKDTGAGKFYLCGFANLYYDCTTKEGRAFHKLAKKEGFNPSKRYYGGFSIRLDNAKYHGNGMFEIMEAAYGNVALHLRNLGFPVGVEGRLD